MISLTWSTILITGVSFTALLGVLKFLANKRKESIWTQWETLSKNKVVLHGLYGGRKLPTPSPFVLKLETYLRMAKIPYEIDKRDIWGPKGKTPWISINGQNVADSQFIIELLERKFDSPLHVYSEEEKAIGVAVRIMMEEYLYWGGVLWRFAYGGRDTLEKVRRGEITLKEWLIFHMIAPSLKSAAKTQGLGRHSQKEVLGIMQNCLSSLSKILGEKQFILGEYPSEVDCAVFGQLAAVLLINGSPFEAKSELKNLKDYCIRMKTKYWPDWDKLMSVTE